MSEQTGTEQYVQLSFDGEEVDTPREKPGTFMWCPETEQWVLRSLRFDWPNELVEGPDDVVEDSASSPENEEDDNPEQVGGVFDITLSYSVDYRFRIPAVSEHQAEERAKDLKLDARPVDAMHVHTDRSKVKTVFEDDEKLPQDYDLYSSEPLWEVYGDEQ